MLKKNSYNYTAALVGVSFVLSAILKLKSIDSFEIYTYSFKVFSLNASFITARLLIGIEFIIGAFFIINAYKKIVVYTSSILLLFFSLFILYLKINNAREHCHCFGDFDISHTASLLKNIVLCVLIVLSNKRDWLNQIIFKKIITIIILLVSLSSPFIISPPDNFYNHKIKENNYNPDLIEGFIENEVSPQTKLICFYGTKCRFCKLSAKKIKVILDKSSSNSLSHIVFWGDKESISDFFSETNTYNENISELDANNFLRITNGKMPLIFTVKDKKILKAYDYRSIDEAEIIQLLNE